MKLKDVRIDPKKVTDGVWVPWVDDAEVLIARVGNAEFTREVQRLTRATVATSGEVSDELMDLIQREALAKTILKGWRGFDEDVDYATEDEAKARCAEAFKETGVEVQPRQRDGRWLVPIPYSWKQAVKWFNDPAMADFYTFVQNVASTRKFFREDRAENTVKA